MTTTFNIKLKSTKLVIANGLTFQQALQEKKEWEEVGTEVYITADPIL